MSNSRRDFLKLATAGAGSLALTALSPEVVRACCWRRDSVREIAALRPIRSEIRATFPANGTVLGRSFTVLGTYFNDNVYTPPVECKLLKMSDSSLIGTGTVTSMGNYWMADFAIPGTTVISSTELLKIKADLVDPPTPPTPASIINLTMAGDGTGGSGTPPIIVTNPGSQLARARDPLKLLATPEGEVNEPTIATVHIRYVQAGRPMVDEYPIDVVNDNGKRKWKKWKFDFSNHAGEGKISFLVRATSTGGRRYTLSEHGLSVEGS